MPRHYTSPPREQPEPRQAHPSTRQLARFMRGELPRLETRAVLRHLLTGCPRCVYFTSRLWGLGQQRPRRAPTVTDAEAFARMQLKEIERELQRIKYRMLGVQATLPPAPIDLAPLLEEETMSGTTQLHAVIKCVLQDSIEPAIRDLRELTAPSGEA